MRFHSVARFGCLVCLDGLKNVGMTDPSGHSLSAESVEATDIAQRQRADPAQLILLEQTFLHVWVQER